MSEELIIAKYRVAYERANGVPFERSLTYRNGWFVFETIVDGEALLVSRHRKAVLLQMTDRLNTRPEGKPS
jgi:hypothetical protein